MQSIIRKKKYETRKNINGRRRKVLIIDIFFKIMSTKHMKKVSSFHVSPIAWMHVLGGYGEKATVHWKHSHSLVGLLSYEKRSATEEY